MPKPGVKWKIEIELENLSYICRYGLKRFLFVCVSNIHKYAFDLLNKSQLPKDLLAARLNLFVLQRNYFAYSPFIKVREQ